MGSKQEHMQAICPTTVIGLRDKLDVEHVNPYKSDAYCLCVQQHFGNNSILAQAQQAQATLQQNVGTDS